MMKTIHYPSNLNGSGLTIGIVTARFNEDITKELLASARETLIKQGVAHDEIHEVWVPGSCELPFAVKTLAMTHRFDALIAIGVIIKGETAHFEYVADFATNGLGKVALDHAIPVIFGVLTTYTREQALERSGPMRLGEVWAMNAIEMANLSRLEILVPFQKSLDL